MTCICASRGSQSVTVLLSKKLLIINTQFNSDHLPRIRKQNLTMNSSLTVYRVCKNLSIDHPVRHVENVSGQAPCWLFVWVKYGLSSHPKAHEHHQHDHNKVHHVNHLQGGKHSYLSFLHVVMFVTSRSCYLFTIFPIIIT